MRIQRAITILLPHDADLRATLSTFCTVQNAVSEIAFTAGKPLRAVELQRVIYEQVKGTLSSQMTITALRLVVGAYERKSSARRAAKPTAGRTSRARSSQ
jgi:hypothetical protein